MNTLQRLVVLYLVLGGWAGSCAAWVPVSAADFGRAVSLTPESLAPESFAAARVASALGSACPFCNAVQQTLAEQMNTSDVVVIADLVRTLEPPARQDALPKAIFKVVALVKGKPDLISVGTEFQGIIVGQFEPGQRVLVMGVNPPDFSWTTPIKVSPRAEEYLTTIPTLPETGFERLRFFQQYLQDAEPFLAFDAYEEFARAPYADVQALKPYMNHDQLIDWLKDPEVSSSRKRLYFTLLGVCGTDDDLPLLETMMKSESGEIRRSLDAMIACYITLRGDAAFDLIDELFLDNPKCDYVDAFSAISAIRFHASESKHLSKERILKSFHHVLKSPERADLIIPDLARWEDWSVIDRMVDLFKNADESSQWVRVPVISYLQICPKPEAKTAIDELRKIDPDAVRRAESLLSWETGGEEESADEFDQNDEMQDDAEKPATDQPAKPSESGDGAKPSEGAKPGDGAGQGDGAQSVLEPASSPQDAAGNSPPASDSAAPNSRGGDSLIPTSAASQQIPETTDEDDASEPLTAIPVKENRNDFVSTASPMPPAIAPRPNAAGVVSTDSPTTEVVAQTLPLRWSILVMIAPLVIGGLMFLLLWSVLNGWFERLIF